MNINKKNLIGAVMASTVGVLFYNVMPIYLGYLMEAKSLGYDQIGYMASAFFLAFSIPSATAYFWIRNIKPRTISYISIIFVAVFLFISSYTNSYTYLIVEILVVGSFSGILATLAMTVIGNYKNSTRWYGFKSASESAAGTLLLFVLPSTLIMSYGFNGVVYGMLIFMLLSIPIVSLISNQPLAESDEDTMIDTSIKDISSIFAWMALLAIFFNYITGSAIWAFAERIADIKEFDSTLVANALGLTLAFAIIGPLISSSISDKYGLKIPFIITSLLMLIGAYGLTAASTLSSYAIFACIQMLGWGGALPFLYSLVSNSDPNGRYIALAIPALGLGSVVGPALAGNLIGESSSMLMLQVLVIVCMTISIVLGLRSIK
ncbi:MFS transporter [Gammaproteobacteria bacterium]|jgi:MFS family permease|nr:MFS transporter [Gammaproteobacteria bacterium]